MTLPPVTAKTDARIAFARDDVALIKAAGEIDIGRACIGNVKAAYAAPKKAGAP